MIDDPNISEKERERRRKISEYRKKVIAEKRRKGLQEYIKRRRREKRKREREEAKKKEKERLKKIKEREKAKLKRKPGRPKKLGRKKKYKRKIIKPPKFNPGNSKPPFIYCIISCMNGTQNKYIGKYRTIEEAYEVLNKLKEENKKENIIFPMKTSIEEKLKNSIGEYLLLEKSNGPNSVLRNDYGKLVEQKTNLDGWIVLDKVRYQKEETFWVFGYNSRSDRKNFMWIYEKLLLSNISNPLDFKRVLLYKNKVIFKEDNGHIELIICKCENDAVRFYNLCQQFIKKDKIKQIIFIGDYSARSLARAKLEDELAELTGWTLKKVRMKFTTFYKK